MPDPTGFSRRGDTQAPDNQRAGAGESALANGGDSGPTFPLASPDDEGRSCLTPRMDPAEDLSKALALLGLQDLPRDPADLSRQVTHRYPATAVWGAEQSWAYRVVWNRCTPATGSNEHRPGQR